MPCLHLQSFSEELQKRGIAELRRNVPFCGWGQWIFYDCKFDLKKIRANRQFAPCVENVEKVLGCWPVQALECSVCGVAVACIFDPEMSQTVVE